MNNPNVLLNQLSSIQPSYKDGGIEEEYLTWADYVCCTKYEDLRNKSAAIGNVYNFMAWVTGCEFIEEARQELLASRPIKKYVNA